MLVVKNGRVVDRMASAFRFCGADCLIVVKKLAFYRTETTYERGKTRFDAFVWDPNAAFESPDGLQASATRMFLTTPRKIRFPDRCAEWLRTRGAWRSGRIL